MDDNYYCLRDAEEGMNYQCDIEYTCTVYTTIVEIGLLDKFQDLADSDALAFVSEREATH